MKINDYISENLKDKIRDIIKQASFNEVFLLGITDNNKKVIDVKVIARGNSFSVPAILKDLKSGDVVIHNHPSGNLIPSEPDTQISSYLGNFGIASYIINNSVDNIYVIVEPFEKENFQEIEVETIKNFFKKDGILNKKISYFEFRNQQIEMALNITDSYNYEKISVVEASTGTGKTLSYLLPSIIWSVQNKEKCVVATNTINLQEQLVSKDLPLITQILPYKFKYVLIKGKNNYICLNKFFRAYQQPELFDIEGHNNEFEQINEWLKITKDGSKTSLNFIPNTQLWESICAESDNCLKTKCKFYNECYVNKMRREANSANILIVNHHILLSDIVLKYSENNYKKYGVLPEYRRIIFDEAHNLEDVATKHLGIKFSYYMILKQLNKIYNLSKGREYGLIPLIRKNLVSKAKISEKKKLIEIINSKILPQFKDVKSHLTYSFDILHTYFSEKSERNQFTSNFKIRIESHFLEDKEFYENCENVFLEMNKELNLLLNLIMMFRKQFSKVAMGDTEEIENSIIADLKYLENKIQGIMNSFGEFIKPANIENCVRWVEGNNFSKKYTLFSSVPVDISKLFFESILLPNKTIVFTSATLSINQKFDFFKTSLGINNVPSKKINELILNTPFDYKKQALVVVPNDIPFPNENNYTDVTSEFLLKQFLISNCSTFLLFTSYMQLKKTLSLLEPTLEKYYFNCLVQGTKSRNYLLNNFKKNKRSILFATDSFWEGVDVQGDALESVVVFKLPFKIPDDPVLEAKNEKIAASGKNPFFSYQLPKAVIKFKQGFGRLIRTKYDKGIIVVLDKRIKTKNYGNLFFNSLPEIKAVYDTQENCIKQISEFFNHK